MSTVCPNIYIDPSLESIGIQPDVSAIVDTLTSNGVSDDVIADDTNILFIPLPDDLKNTRTAGDYNCHDTLRIFVDQHAEPTGVGRTLGHELGHHVDYHTPSRIGTKLGEFASSLAYQAEALAILSVAETQGKPLAVAAAAGLYALTHCVRGLKANQRIREFTYHHSRREHFARQFAERHQDVDLLTIEHPLELEKAYRSPTTNSPTFSPQSFLNIVAINMNIDTWKAIELASSASQKLGEVTTYLEARAGFVPKSPEEIEVIALEMARIWSYGKQPKL